MKAIASKLPLDLLVDHYPTHLLDVAGLQPGACQRWVFFVRLARAPARRVARAQRVVPRALGKGTAHLSVPAPFMNLLWRQQRMVNFGQYWYCLAGERDLALDKT